MGRLKKYETNEEKIEAQRRWAREYYYRNKEKINKKTMKKYYEKNNDRKGNSGEDNKSV